MVADLSFPAPPLGTPITSPPLAAHAVLFPSLYPSDRLVVSALSALSIVGSGRYVGVVTQKLACLGGAVGLEALTLRGLAS